MREATDSRRYDADMERALRFHHRPEYHHRHCRYCFLLRKLDEERVRLSMAQRARRILRMMLRGS
jgi:hypothetical protein